MDEAQTPIEQSQNTKEIAKKQFPLIVVAIGMILLLLVAWGLYSYPNPETFLIEDANQYELKSLHPMWGGYNLSVKKTGEFVMEYMEPGGEIKILEGTIDNAEIQNLLSVFDENGFDSMKGITKKNLQPDEGTAKIIIRDGEGRFREISQPFNSRTEEFKAIYDEFIRITNINNQILLSSEEISAVALSKPITGWDIYKNDEYNYFFKYPTSWQVEEGDRAVSINPNLDEWIGADVGSSIPLFINIKIYNEDIYESEQVIDHYLSPGGEPTTVDPEIQITDCDEARKIQSVYIVGGPEMGHSVINRVIYKSYGKIYEFEFKYGIDGYCMQREECKIMEEKFIDDNNKIQCRVLSSLKFIADKPTEIYNLSSHEKILYNMPYNTNGKTLSFEDGLYTEPLDTRGEGGGSPQDLAPYFFWEIESLNYGDVNNDGVEDAVVGIKESQRGATGVGHRLHVVVNDIDENNVIYDSAYIILGDRVPIFNIRVENEGLIKMDARVHGENDSLCCPTVETTYEYKLIDGELVLISGIKDAFID